MDLCAQYMKCLKKLYLNNVGFEVLTAVVMESTIFWYITPYNPLKVSQVDFQRTTQRYIPEDGTLPFWIILSYEDTVFCDVMLCKKLPAFRRNLLPAFLFEDLCIYHHGYLKYQ
jgi:hypothetical protein